MPETQNTYVSEKTYIAVSNWINSCIAEGSMPSTKELCDKYHITHSQVDSIARRMGFAQ